jgi:hypothetical protein
MENTARKLGLKINQEKTKYMIAGRKNNLKQYKIEDLKINNYKFERVTNFKYLGIILNEGNNHQVDLQERIKNANKTYFMLQTVLKIKTYLKLKLRQKNTIIDKTLIYASETWTLTKSDRKQLNIFERKVNRRILGPLYGNEKQNWMILTNKEIYAIVKNPTIRESVRLHRLCRLGPYREWKKTEFPKEYYI